MPFTFPTAAEIVTRIQGDANLSPAFAAALAPGATLAAEFTNGSRHREPVLTFTRIENGRRTHVETVPVASKRDARAVAAERGAKPWNF